jgi:hypothetical protein
MLFIQSIMINLVLTKSLGPKRHTVLLVGPIFASFYVCHTDLGKGVTKNRTSHRTTKFPKLQKPPK